MTRYHYFNTYYPEEAKKISEGYTDINRVIWNAFARATWLHKYFEFTPKLIKDNPVKDQEQGQAKSQGTDQEKPWYSDEINL